MSHKIIYDTKLKRNEWGWRTWSCNCGAKKHTWNTDHGTQTEISNHIKPKSEEKEKHNINYGYDPNSKTWWWICWCGKESKYFSTEKYATECGKKHLDGIQKKENKHTIEVLRNNIHGAYNAWINMQRDNNEEIRSLQRLSILAYKTLKQLQENKDSGAK